MKISPIMSQVYQSRLSILPKKKYTVKNLLKTCKLLPKGLNFAKSGHTGREQVEISLIKKLGTICLRVLSFFDCFEVATFRVKRVQKLCQMGCWLVKWVVQYVCM